MNATSKFRDWIEILESRIAPAAVASIDLGLLDGSNGFRLDGDVDDFSGYSVSGAGDVNGDGFGDVIIGAFNANSAAGRSYVVFGGADGFAPSLDLSSLDGSNGFRLDGIDPNDFSGGSVSGAGDINGDGFDDLIVGAISANSAAGESYVVFGNSGFAASLNLSTLDGNNGFRLDGIVANDNSGISASSAGDVNGDGFDDLIIGAHRADVGLENNAGQAYVVFGKAEGFSAALDLSTLNGNTGFRMDGIAGGDFLGRSVNGVGDLNGDGFDDVIIGAYGADPNGSASGTSYVVFGKAAGFADTLDLSILDGTNGFTLNGDGLNASSGFSVQGAGDVNRDGFSDLIVGAFGTAASAGETYVVFGKAGGFNASLNLSTLDGSNGFRIDGIDAGDKSGRSVSGAGDVNGDGFDDLIIGAYGANSLAGESYVVFGKAGGLSASLDLSTLDGSNGFRIDGIDASDRSGRSVSDAGDVNGDGFDDLIIGAYGANSNFGESYVIFGFGTGTAVVSANGKSATYTDIDGDTVTIKSSKGGLTVDNLQLSGPNALGGSRLVVADFTDPAFKGSNITLKTKPGPSGGDGIASVGSIFFGANTLGKVKIDGDLGQIDGGGDDATVDAIKSLAVFSLGLFPVGESGPSTVSEIDGGLGALTVKSDFFNVGLAVNGPLGKAKIGGAMDGASLFVEGIANPTSKHAVALKALSVTGSVVDSQILLGYDAKGNAVNSDVQAGKVTVKGNWIASDLVAGAEAGADGDFGTDDDAVIGGGLAEIVSKIAGIKIGGQAFGTTDVVDHFGWVAETIAAITVAKGKVALTGGLDAIPVGVTGDLVAREVG